ncbi:hypothetical protein HK102_006182, partial [Quaeritorhiza haematococci]
MWTFVWFFLTVVLLRWLLSSTDKAPAYKRPRKRRKTGHHHPAAAQSKSTAFVSSSSDYSSSSSSSSSSAVLKSSVRQRTPPASTTTTGTLEEESEGTAEPNNTVGYTARQQTVAKRNVFFWLGFLYWGPRWLVTAGVRSRKRSRLGTAAVPSSPSTSATAATIDHNHRHDQFLCEGSSSECMGVSSDEDVKDAEGERGGDVAEQKILVALPGGMPASTSSSGSNDSLKKKSAGFDGYSRRRSDVSKKTETDLIPKGGRKEERDASSRNDVKRDVDMHDSSRPVTEKQAKGIPGGRSRINVEPKTSQIVEELGIDDTLGYKGIKDGNQRTLDSDALQCFLVTGATGEEDEGSGPTIVEDSLARSMDIKMVPVNPRKEKEEDVFVTGIRRLPTELLELTMIFVDYQDLASCQLVCRYWHQVSSRLLYGTLVDLPAYWLDPILETSLVTYGRLWLDLSGTAITDEGVEGIVRELEMLEYMFL